MYFGRFVPLSLMFWTIQNVPVDRDQELKLLQNATNALFKGLKYMEDHVSEINLDGAFGCRLVEGLLQDFLESTALESDVLADDRRARLKMLSIKAGRIADEAKQYIKAEDSQYYAAVGGLLERSKKPMWYPGRLTNPLLIEWPYPCSESHFNESFSDQCLKEILDSRKGKTSRCSLSDGCLDIMTKPQQRGYMLTHQVLYFQIMEKENCVKRSTVKEIPEILQNTLCSNVMRDAQEIDASGYPLNHRDLFMEQIGLCGLWGYKEFYQPHWLSKILEWQLLSGCFANKAKWYCTDDCLSHKTAVALLAIAANIRFIAEKTFLQV